MNPVSGFLLLAGSGDGSGFLLTDNVEIEVITDPDVEIIEFYDVEIVEEPVDVEIVEVVDIELDC